MPRKSSVPLDYRRSIALYKSDVTRLQTHYPSLSIEDAVRRIVHTHLNSADAKSVRTLARDLTDDQ